MRIENIHNLYIVRDADERKSLIMRKKKDHGFPWS